MSRLDFALPGRWWKVPLDIPERMNRSAAALAEHALGRADHLATARAELRQAVAQAASFAARASALEFHFAQEVVPGVPVPLFLAVYKPALPQRLSTSASAQAAADSLAAGLTANSADSTVTTWTQGALGVARELRVLQPSPDAELPTTQLRVDYWISLHNSDDTFIMSFTAPLYWEQVAEGLLALTDAVVSTLAWEVDAEAPSNA